MVFFSYATKVLGVCKEQIRLSVLLLQRGGHEGAAASEEVAVDSAQLRLAQAGVRAPALGALQVEDARG